ncbi:hypothetical protein BU26DRAFT_524809 [Trematosphaeria pertusa]|uniref:tRNA (guanine(9)-N1)-methyltransferase n=1 Tax=Trematosphaeria pertusa TaxID=390896 RepID=A0A6A6HVF5_9PLEO|nr:uncharacterized protein BU26DRAFT_524809 [Trematosphaeria pertusa]KAF2242175.1 hypothetical protein BU26DRAFT_524809 [Trematosphaeria pertusa]
MESEERPAKMRKLEHSVEDEHADIADAGLLDGLESAENTETPDQAADGEDAAPKLSKNQLKKQKRLERWEAGREDRKIKRKEKTKAKKERKREAWQESRANGEEPQTLQTKAPRRGEPPGTQVPISVIFDCDFEDLMFDNELKSLGLQITRCYSDNRKAPFRCHLAVSSFGGKLKERFDGILAKQYTSWKGFRFFEEDFVHAADQAKEWMKGGIVAGALKTGEDVNGEQETDHQNAEEEGEVVYLSAESDVTLERLKPNSTYIIGGLVDKNRHKGLCYKRAMNRGVKTAKLPIGEFLQMKSRQVLVTNHVLEIMLKWLEFGDWGKAFMGVIPKRKGGVLKSEAQDGDEEEEETPGRDVEEFSTLEEVDQPLNHGHEYVAGDEARPTHTG